MKPKNFDDCCGIVPYSYEEYLKLKTCPVQRNHIKRARDNKTKEKLQTLLPQHTFIASAELTQDSYDPINGETYKAGTVFIVDSHTRREFWKLGESDAVPEKLTSQHYKVESIAALRDLYYTFDNTTNTEKSADLAYGAARYLGVEFKNHKLYQVTGLTWGAHFYSKQQFPKTSGYDGDKLIDVIKEFTDELKFLDSFIWDKKIDIPHPLRSAAILFLKKRNDTYSRKIVQRVFQDDFDSKDENGRQDGVTNIIQWLKSKDADFAANFKTIPVLTEKFLYWLNQAYLEETVGKDRLEQKGVSSGVLDKYVRISKLDLE
ncbi:hypothetical protein AAJ61_gp047 [Synechococcus phage ACG-2014j]|uniref:Uncharacterized protein n=2 Tax=Potamoivirus TaxID=2948872 RepID=A0A1D8KLK0_9CAUD|nr:hypothetical protein AAJ61_gp047 [Synechococcus phage ACG-2014j]YP_009320480.1 hypothetical protein BOQ05_gp217 [Synechococcus phage S-CAM4]AIX23942.1 hypothetical protein Syn7803US103_47 [Synechococcus phage ACG-2014j]AOV59270.1 hypothetical protein C440309_047 [Synechococcus phage S-CAM4]AOV59508.1 hypothetical protein S330809_047 [Synechococcus phage S-CAM4]AOV59746.1 hypothetical protein N231010_047 [Synechococcus phage S-CAM4]